MASHFVMLDTDIWLVENEKVFIIFYVVQWLYSAVGNFIIYYTVGRWVKFIEGTFTSCTIISQFLFHNIIYHSIIHRYII